MYGEHYEGVPGLQFSKVKICILKAKSSERTQRFSRFITTRQQKMEEIPLVDSLTHVFLKRYITSVEEEQCLL